MCRLSKPTQKSLNNPLSNKDIEFKIKRLPTKKALDPDGFPKEDTVSVYTNSFRKQLPNIFKDVSITLIPKQGKETTRKRNCIPLVT